MVKRYFRLMDCMLSADGLFVILLIEQETQAGKYEPFLFCKKIKFFLEKLVTDYHKIRVYIQRNVERRKRP